MTFAYVRMRHAAVIGGAFLLERSRGRSRRNRLPMDETEARPRRRWRTRALALAMVVLFGFPAIYVPILILGSHVRSQGALGSLSTCRGATPRSGSTVQPQGGIRGVEGHFRNTISETQAKAFTVGFPAGEVLWCHRSTLQSYDPRRRIFTAFFSPKASQQDREQVAAFLRTSGLFDVVNVEP